MPFDHFVVGAIAQELNDTICGGKIEKIYQPEKDELILQINVPPSDASGGTCTDIAGKRRKCELYLSSNSNRPALYLSTIKTGNPQNPPGFCMLLRKHILNGRISGVKQAGSERIVCIYIDTTNELGFSQRLILLLEAMGKHSNIILLEPADDAKHLLSENENSASANFPQGRVIDSIKRVYENVSRERQIYPGVPYTPPPPGKGISPIMSEEITLKYDLAHYDALAAAQDYTPLLYLNEQGEIKDFHVFRLEIYAGFRACAAGSVSELIETFYESRERAGRLKQKASDLDQALKTRLDKLLLKQQRLLEDIERAKDADAYRRKGELITANMHLIEKGMSEVLLTDYASITPENETGDRIRVTLNPQYTASQNAQKYFKKYNKEKNALVYKQEQLKNTSAEINFLESYQVFLENAAEDAQIDELREELSALGYAKQKRNGQRKPVIRPAYLEFKSSSGRSIFVGRNNRENDELTLKKAKPDDLWLHTKDIPGSHVILAGDGTTGTGDTAADEQSIREAAAIAAFYSKGKQSSNVPVDYTLVKYVKKPSGAKPGMVIFTHNKTLYVEPKKS
ncbi:MAG: NFACT family protein [Clostridiales Family XIII bacterium]|nr:NFACT family protein [Clostridiales Family XIII bacterium]